MDETVRPRRHTPSEMMMSIGKNGAAKTIGGGISVVGLVAVLYMLGIVEIAPANPDKSQIHKIQIDVAGIMKDISYMQKDIKEIKTAITQR